ncbi:hypothetical protein B2J88_00390 [Rhodococcus sp. SRB_17]|nr:hypothetical protein [Rhodococcus sp. SRB_17]
MSITLTPPRPFQATAKTYGDLTRWTFELPAVDGDIVAEQIQSVRDGFREMVDPNNYSPNDLGNANMFTDYHGDNLRGLQGTSSWVAWDSRQDRYSQRIADQSLYNDFCAPAVERRLRKAAEAERNLARSTGKEDDAKAANNRAKALEVRANATGQLAAMEKYLKIAHTNAAVSRTDFDGNPNLLGVGDGKVLDFARILAGDGWNSALRPATREDMVLYHTPTEFDPDAQTAWVDDYLDKFLPDEAYRREVFRFLGYTLQRGNPARIALFIKGDTGSGKSTLLRLFREAIGDLGGTVNLSVFRSKADGPSPEILSAVYLFVTFSSELSTRTKMHADHVKMITGAGDEVAARDMYQSVVHKVQPWFTPIIATNEMPTITDADEALKRRLLVLPFNRQLRDSEQTDHAITTADRQHFLRLLVEGRLDYLQNGIDLGNLHPDILSATAEGHSDLSFFQSWQSSSVKVAESPRHGWAVTPADAWTHFDREQRNSGLTHDSRLDRTQFAKRMRDAFGKPQSRKRKLDLKKTHTAANTQGKSIYLTLEWADQLSARLFGC